MVAMQAKVKLIDRSHDSVREEEIKLTGAHLVICEAKYLYTLMKHQAVRFYQLAVDRISFFSRGNGGVLPVSAGTWPCLLFNWANQKLVTRSRTPQAQPVSPPIEFK